MIQLIPIKFYQINRNPWMDKKKIKKIMMMKQQFLKTTVKLEFNKPL